MTNKSTIQGSITLPAKMTGLTLLEILVAVVVLSIGLLGMAGLQATSMRGNHDAYLRSLAVYAVQDIADRMRVNREAVYQGSYVLADIPSAPAYDCVSSFTGTDFENRCTSQEMAAADVSLWVTGQPAAGEGQTGGLQAALPAGSGSISCADSDTTDDQTCSPGSVHTITVSWDGSRNGLTNSNVQMSFQP